MNKLLRDGIIKTTPKRWSKEEVDRLLEYKGNNVKAEQIAKILGRSEVSISIKLKRLGKKNNTYNKAHRQDKYEVNERFVYQLEPKTILDVFAGDSFYKRIDDITLVDNDIDSSYDCAFNMDSYKLLCLLTLYNKKFDIVDLDPFGSAINCFDLAIQIAKKGIVITLGEMGHKRFKRLDFVSRWYGINSMEDFNTQNIISELRKIAKRHKKEIIPIFTRDYNRIARIWFVIKDIKITEQWELDK